MKKLLIAVLCGFLLIGTPLWAADYDAHKKIDELDDASGAITGSTRIPVQDMNDLDKIGAATIQQIIDKGLEAPGLKATTQTTDATQTTLDSITLLDNNVYEVSATVLGNRSDVTDSWATYRIIATVYRDGGVATLIGSVSTLHTQEISSNNTNLDATFTVNSNDVRISVTGLVSETWNWGGNLSCINLSN